MDTAKEILKVLGSQREHYVAMREAIDKQTAYIEAMDIGRLTAGASQVRSLMRKIRDLDARFRPLRQSWTARSVERLPSREEAIDLAVTEIKSLIGSIQESRDRNATLLKQNMSRLKVQMTGLETQAKAALAYGGKAAPKEPPARFIDKSN